jgi:hypothetical protein
MLTVHRDQEVKSMPKLRDENETSQRHRLSLFLPGVKNRCGPEHTRQFQNKVKKQHECFVFDPRCYK